MGNHEFCGRCHASDFHIGFTCEEAYPEKLKEAEAQRAQQERDRVRRNAAVEAVVARLRTLKIPAEVDTNTVDGKPYLKVVVEGRHLLGSRRKAMLDTDPKVQARRRKAYERKYGDGW